MRKAFLTACFCILSAYCCPAQERGALLFRLSGGQGATAEYALGEADPNFLAGVSVIPDGADGPGLHCGYRQLLTWKAPGNIYAREGTLSFFWRSGEPFTKTPFPIFRVSFADHTSWDMVWLRIDYNGQGFDAFVTDNNLARIRVSINNKDELPAPEAWTHFALSWDETRGIRFYINGQERARRDTTVTLDTGLDQFGPHSRIISPYQVQSAYNMQRGGDIDELRIYGKMLTDSEIAALARNEDPQTAELQRRFTDAGEERAWQHFLGFDGAAPPVLDSPRTTVRKLGVNEIYDLKRWYWKAGDGIRETTWPGVYNRSRIEGRDDYFQLPDWDCYSTSGWQVRFLLPEEPWNYVELTGGASGRLGVSARADGSASTPLARKEPGTQRSFFQLDRERSGQTLTFDNDVQETPVQELNVFYVHEGDAPQGILRLEYALEDFNNLHHPALVEAEEMVRGRYRPGERRMLLAQPAEERSYDNPMDHALQATGPVEGGKPLVHIVIPNDIRDLGIYEPQTVETAPTEFGEFGIAWRSNIRSYSWIKLRAGLDGIRLSLPAFGRELAGPDGLIPLNIQVKDPVWPLRDWLDFSFSVRPGEERTLWLDLRDRILPDDKPLCLALAGAGPADFPDETLKKIRIELVFKDYDAARAEHVADRFTQVRDAYAMLCEENTTSRRLSKYRQIEADLNDLLKVDPDNAIGLKYWHIYNSEHPLPYTEPVAPEGIPEWAFLQLEVLKKYREVFEWFVDNRQIDNGEFGGGISDDTDLTNHFPGLIHLGVLPDKFGESLHRFMEAVYAEGTLTDGMSTIQTDGLHTYEEGVNTVVQVNTVEYGNPLQVERLMESAKSVRDRLLGETPGGHLHFRSDYFSATEMADAEPWTWSSYREYYHTGPGLLLGDAYGNGAAREYLIRFADSILAHAVTDDDGRLRLPNEINFLTDEARSWGGTYALPLMWYAWRWTGNEKYQKAVRGSGWDFREYTPKALAAQFRRELRTLDAREYIMTEGSLWIDRVGFNCETIQHSRLGGVAMTRGDNLVPSNPIRWHFERPEDAEQLAILVSGASPAGFDIEFFNTARRPVKAVLEGVEALGGQWVLTLPDGREQQVEFGRARRVALQIPARKSWRIRMRLMGAGEDLALRPDVGIGPQDLELTPDGLSVTVHNLGGVAVGPVSVVLQDARGRVLAQTKTPAIPAPADLVPKTARVILPVPQGCDLSACSVLLNPGRESEEIYPANNATSCRLPASRERPE